MNKKGGETLVQENIIFIILNLIFVSLLLIFVVRASSGASILEEKYAKQISLILDAAKSGTTINIPLDDTSLELIDKNNLIRNNEQKVVEIDNNMNTVRVKLSHRGGYKHIFYSDVNIKPVKIENNKIILIIGE